MGEGIYSVDGGGHPGHEQGDEEEARHFGVAEGGPVGFHGGPVLSFPPEVAAGVVG